MDLRSFLRFLQYEKRYSRHTIIAYENDLLQFSSFLKKTYDFDDLHDAQHLHVRSWLVSLIESGTGARSISRKLSSLKTFYKFGMRTGKTNINPMTRIVAPKAPKRLPSFINKNQMELMWRHYDFGEGFEGLRDRMIFEIFYATGMRRSELINLDEKSIDFYNQSFRVMGKGNKERLIPFNAEMKKWLKEYISERNNFFSRKIFPSLIVSKEGEKMGPRKIYSIVNSVLKEVTTIDKKSPHVLRHTFATHLLNNGAEINAIKELLGHSSLSATQVYTHNTIDKLKDIYKKAHPKA